MKLCNKTYLLSISIVGCTSLLGRVNPPTNTKQAQALVTTAQNSSDVTKVEEIYRALQSVQKKYPTPFAKVENRLKALKAAQPTPVVSQADQKMVAQLQKQLTAQATSMQVLQDQTKTITQLQQEIAQLKTQLQTCQTKRTTPPPLPPEDKGPPVPPPAVSTVKGPPVPPPDIHTKKTDSKERTGLLEQIRAGTKLKKPKPTTPATEPSNSLLDIIAQRRKGVAPDDENNDTEYEDWV